MVGMLRKQVGMNHLVMLEQEEAADISEERGG